MGNDKDDTNRVIITEVGASDDRQAAEDGNPGKDDRADYGSDGYGPQRGTDGIAGQRVGGRRSVNPFFVAAWLLAILMMVVGAMSVAFSLQGMNPYVMFLPAPDGAGESTSYQILMSLLISPVGAGSLLVVASCMLAGILLAVHGINHARRRSDPVLAVQA